MIILVTHAALIGGKIYEAPSSTIFEILLAKKQDFLFLRHSIDGNLPSTLYKFV